jgi:hypothetical protein
MYTYVYVCICMHKVALIYFFPELISVNKFNKYHENSKK